MAIVGPIAPESNPTINPQYYQPQQFFISAIALGQTTTVTATESMDYVVGQLVRLLIPSYYGSIELNERQGYVLSIPSSTQVVVGIDSSKNVSAFISPYATITGATQANPCVLTANNGFSIGQKVQVKSVEGMTQLNNTIYTILARSSTTITINVNSSAFGAYTAGGTATVVSTLPQIVAVGDINSGQINSSGRINNLTYINGSFINISP